jgi:hypothetical protein
VPKIKGDIMNRPLTFTEELLTRLDADLREEYEERAAIMEYDGGLPREFAENLALLNIFWRHPNALLELSVLKAELNGDTEFIVTTNVQNAMGTRKRGKRGM